MPALIHSAYFWLKKDLTAEDRATFESELQLLTQITYLERAFAGKPAATEERPVTDHSFDYATSFHFKTLADHEFYQAGCQDHARFVAKCKAFFERVVVYDVAPLA
ncbi:MAG: Dabb family protein [Chthoniobacter sp.]|uniref:Dabb family protein n=1 Tax=Chthoniobacter sp. TaxID=2510640 RepID=UPI0032A196F6